MAITSLLTLLATKEFKYSWAETAFIILTIVGFIIGGYVYFDMRRNEKSNSEIANTIRGKSEEKT